MADGDAGWSSARRTNHADAGLSLEPPPNWTHQALCTQVDPELFYPEKGGSTKDAKRVCGRCDVRELCLAYALDAGERFGVWGGLAERERKKLELERERHQRPKLRCGTPNGYQAHRRRGEAACQACRDANAAYYRRIRQEKESVA